MRSLLLAVLLGFFTHSQSVPVNDVTEVPAKAEADVLREAITDGFLVDRPIVPFDESPKHSSTNHTDVVLHLSDARRPAPRPEDETSAQPTPDDADVMEASAPVEGSADYPTSEEEDNGTGLYSSPTPSHLPAQSSSYTVLLRTDSVDFSSSTVSTQSMYPVSPADADEQDLFIEETTKSPTTTDLQGVEWDSFDALLSTTTTTPGHDLSDGHKTISQSHSSVSRTTEVPVHRFDSSLTTLSPSSTSSVVPSHSPESESVSESEDMLATSPDTSFSTTSSSSLIFSSISALNLDIDAEDEPTAVGTATMTPTSTAGTATMTPTSTAGTVTMTPTSTAGFVADKFQGLFVDVEGSGDTPGQPSVVPPAPEEEQTEATNRLPSAVEQNTPSKREGHSTPAWLMVLAVVVAVAALALLSIAIATRDRWTTSKQEKKKQPEMRAAGRQGELETFLDRERPREDGHVEYTVISLEELPEKEPLH